MFKQFTAWMSVGFILNACMSSPTPRGVASTPATTMGEACRAANIKAFSVDASVLFGGGNLCTTKTTQYVAFLNKLADFNQRAVSFIGVPMETLNPRGINLVVAQNPGGPISSSYDAPAKDPQRPGEIYMGVFSGWKPEQEINWGVYAHELGHALFVNASGQNQPPALRALSRTPFIAESTADLLALELAGDVISNGQQLPGCASDLRRVLPIQTYAYPADYFRDTFAQRRASTCCEYLTKKKMQTPESSEMCSQVADRKLKAFDHTKMSFDLFKENPGSFDPHQLSLPLNAFLISLTNKIGRSAGALWMEVLRSPTLPAGALNKRSCYIPALGEHFRPAAFEVVDLESLMGLLRSRLTATEQKSFDELAKKHELKMGYAIAKYMGQNVNGEKDFFVNLQSFTEGPHAAEEIKTAMASGCFKGSPAYQNWSRDKKACQLSCE